MKRIIDDQYILPLKSRRRSISNVTLGQRKILERMLQKGAKIKEISQATGMTRSTIYFERMRMGSIDVPYDAEKAHADYIEKRKCKKRNELSEEDKKRIVKLYKLVNDSLSKSKVGEVRANLRQMIPLLEGLGANPDRMKNYVTGVEEERIIQLYKEGKTYTTIQNLMGRSRSTISEVIERNRHHLHKTKENYTYDNLKSKWITANN